MPGSFIDHHAPVIHGCQYNGMSRLNLPTIEVLGIDQDNRWHALAERDLQRIKATAFIADIEVARTQPENPWSWRACAGNHLQLSGQLRLGALDSPVGQYHLGTSGQTIPISQLRPVWE